VRKCVQVVLLPTPCAGLHSNTLILTGNVAATANNIAAHELLFRFGIVAGLPTSVNTLDDVAALLRLRSGLRAALLSDPEHRTDWP